MKRDESASPQACFVERRRPSWKKHLCLGLCWLQVACADNGSTLGPQGEAGGSAGALGSVGGTSSETGGAASTDSEPAVPIPGFRADYFFEYRELVHSRIEANIQHVWANENAEPGPGVGEDWFSARYSAVLSIESEGTYEFATLGDDGVRLWVGDELLIDDWRTHPPERHSAEIHLGPGEVPLRLEYFEANFDAHLSLFWTPPGGEEELLDERFVVTAEGSPVAPKAPYKNPVYRANRPDPGVLADGDPPVYYLVATGGQFPVRRSYDLVFWEETTGVILPEGKPAWAANGSRNWAPELHKVGDKYIAYYTSVNGEDVLSIGAAYSDSPTDEYTDLGAPLVEHPDGVVSPHYFKDSDGKHYLTYKVHGNAHQQPTPIYLRELAPDGLSFAPGSTEIEILRNDPSTWEGGNVEGQWIIKRGDTYFLFYSGNTSDHQYKTGVARASSVAGPYQKHDSPILTSNDAWVGPGHGSVVPAGPDLYYVYHAWVSNGQGGRDTTQGRQVLVDKIDFVDNWPIISDGTPSNTLQPRPGSAGR